ncbi:hypothetical protein GCM10009092_45860 [Bowmanella denitrificans]|uniref:Uncharacterized protein n=1 Tax=Bowmanella denitrificans TaxID=366582 RepID=A0ABN0XY51_9ALTE
MSKLTIKDCCELISHLRSEGQSHKENNNALFIQGNNSAKTKKILESLLFLFLSETYQESFILNIDDAKVDTEEKSSALEEINGNWACFSLTVKKSKLLDFFWI